MPVHPHDGSPPRGDGRPPPRGHRLSVPAKLLVVAVILGAVRLLLVGNPWVWEVYAARLHPEDIGWRQVSTIKKKLEGFRPHPEQPRLLAVGSSQTGAVYRVYADSHPDLAIFEMAAMGPFDFVTYSRLIRRYGADTLLLFLSDFDMGRPADPDALVLAPSQGLRSFGLWGRILAEPSLGGRGALVAEMTAGEIFPEFKYRFVFRGIVDKAMRRLSQRLAPPAPDGSEREPIETRIDLLRSEISEAHLPFQMRFLTAFLDETTGWGANVVIVEGQYNPLVADSATLRVRERVQDRLRELAEARPHVDYVPSRQILEFSQSDFQDLSHVTPEAGYAFVQRLMEYLGRSNPPDSPPEGLVHETP